MKKFFKEIKDLFTHSNLGEVMALVGCGYALYIAPIIAVIVFVVRSVLDLFN